MRHLNAEGLRAEIAQLLTEKNGKLTLHGRSSKLAERMIRFQEREQLTCREAGERLGLGMGQVQYLRTVARGRRQTKTKKVSFKPVEVREKESLQSLPGADIEVRTPEGIVCRVSTVAFAAELVRALRGS